MQHLRRGRTGWTRMRVNISRVGFGHYRQLVADSYSSSLILVRTSLFVLLRRPVSSLWKNATRRHVRACAEEAMDRGIERCAWSCALRIHSL